jgi:trimethylamine:corrinoid methyltransferase-like protein
MFMDKLHTVERMRTAAFLPDIADRDNRQLWREKGSLDSQARALRRVREILSRDNPAHFSPDVDARIRAAFIGLVSGDLELPEGWTRETAPPRQSRQE